MQAHAQLLTIMNTNKVELCDLIEGRWYHLKGQIQNGDFITNEDVSRKITRITDKHIYCECGRKFIINDKLIITNCRQLS